MALSLRNALKDARNPENFLFVDLPLLFGLKPFTAEHDAANVDAFFHIWNPAFTELKSAYEVLLTRLQSALLLTFEADSIDDIRQRASSLLGRVSDPKLVTLVTRLADPNLSGSAWIESVAAGVIGRVPETWTDADETRFTNTLPSLNAGFRSAELVAFAMTEAQKEAVDEERSAIRVSVAAPGGHEEARVIIMSRHRSQQAEESADKLKSYMKRAFKGQSEEVQMAALGYLMREMLKNADKGK